MRFRLIKHKKHDDSFIIGSYPEAHDENSPEFEEFIHVGILVAEKNIGDYITLHHPGVADVQRLHLLRRGSKNLYYEVQGKRIYLNVKQEKELEHFVENFKKLAVDHEFSNGLAGANYRKNISWKKVKVWGMNENET